MLIALIVWLMFLLLLLLFSLTYSDYFYIQYHVHVICCQQVTKHTFSSSEKTFQASFQPGGGYSHVKTCGMWECAAKMRLFFWKKPPTLGRIFMKNS